MPIRYPIKHGGTAIFCGSAPCVFEDLEMARKMRPGAMVLGANLTAAMIPEIKHIWTQHNNLAHELKKKLPFGVSIHARANVLGVGVDYVWPSLNWVGGSSGVAGALWARHGMGFDEVIMAGVPLMGSHYSPEYPAIATKPGGAWAEDNQMIQWLEQLRGHMSRGKTDGIYSMSGRTRDLLGAPQ